MLKRILRTARTVLRPPKGPATPLSEASRRKIVRGVVSATATGHVHLQRGEYASRKDIDERIESIRSHEFEKDA